MDKPKTCYYCGWPKCKDKDRSEKLVYCKVAKNWLCDACCEFTMDGVMLRSNSFRYYCVKRKCEYYDQKEI